MNGNGESVRPSGVTAAVTTIGRVVELQLELPKAAPAKPRAATPTPAHGSKKQQEAATAAVVVVASTTARVAPTATLEAAADNLLPAGTVWQ